MATHSSRYPHFWLYAKHWYEQGDLIEDSRKLVANYCGGDVKHINLNDCFSLWMSTFDEATHHCKEHEASYRSILQTIWDRHNPQSILARLYEPEKVEYSIIRAIVSTLSLVAVRNSKLYNPDVDETPFIEFGIPDANVLPLSKTAKERVAVA
jgi:hypothetical protein